MLQNEIRDLFEFIEPADINCDTYSYKIHQLLLRVCIEIENNFKAIMRENIYTPTSKKSGKPRLEDKWTINDYLKINNSHHLSSYSVVFPTWTGEQHKTRRPFKAWGDGDSLSWYNAYNKSKHDRSNNFMLANFNNLLDAYAGLFVVITSQFGTYSFQPGPTILSFGGDSFYNGEFGIGDYLILGSRGDWTDNESYEFDWTILKNEKVRFEKFDYNNI
jgi:hypothetical protein